MNMNTVQIQTLNTNNKFTKIFEAKVHRNHTKKLQQVLITVKRHGNLHQLQSSNQINHQSIVK